MDPNRWLLLGRYIFTSDPLLLCRNSKRAFNVGNRPVNRNRSDRVTQRSATVRLRSNYCQTSSVRFAFIRYRIGLVAIAKTSVVHLLLKNLHFKYFNCVLHTCMRLCTANQKNGRGFCDVVSAWMNGGGFGWLNEYSLNKCLS